MLKPYDRARYRIALASFFSIALAASASAGCQPLTDKSHDYIVCSFDTHTDHIGLYWRDRDGAPYGSVERLRETLAAQGQRLVFAMNGGMYDPQYAPVGFYIEDGRTLHGANTRNGFGNFHLKPNGVFYLGESGAGVRETEGYLQAKRNDRFATQSGPMLVIAGRIHPRIRAVSTSAKIRNGVGVRDGHVVVFALSREPVSFYDFATLFKDRLGTPDALFLDGSISTLYTPQDGTIGGFAPLGPIIGVTEP